MRSTISTFLCCALSSLAFASAAWAEPAAVTQYSTDIPTAGEGRDPSTGASLPGGSPGAATPDPLPPGVTDRLPQADAPVLEQIATSPQLGAPAVGAGARSHGSSSRPGADGSAGGRGVSPDGSSSHHLQGPTLSSALGSSLGSGAVIALLIAALLALGIALWGLQRNRGRGFA